MPHPDPDPPTQQQIPVTNVAVVLAVVGALTLFALGGLSGTIYLCHTSSNPILVEAAVKMIQTDPSSAMAALMLLRADAAVIAIVSGLTGVAVGSLGGVLNSSRTQYATTPQTSNGNVIPFPPVQTLSQTETTTRQTTTQAAPVATADPIPVVIQQPPSEPVPVDTQQKAAEST